MPAVSIHFLWLALLRLYSWDEVTDGVENPPCMSCLSHFIWRGQGICCFKWRRNVMFNNRLTLSFRKALAMLWLTIVGAWEENITHEMFDKWRILHRLEPSSFRHSLQTRLDLNICSVNQNTTANVIVRSQYDALWSSLSSINKMMVLHVLPFMPPYSHTGLYSASIRFLLRPIHPIFSIHPCLSMANHQWSWLNRDFMIDMAIYFNLLSRDCVDLSTYSAFIIATQPPSPYPYAILHVLDPFASSFVQFSISPSPHICMYTNFIHCRIAPPLLRLFSPAPRWSVSRSEFPLPTTRTFYMTARSSSSWVRLATTPMNMLSSIFCKNVPSRLTGPQLSVMHEYRINQSLGSSQAPPKSEKP